MKEKLVHQAEWLFIVALLVSVGILGRMRMHQQNLACFLLLSLGFVTVIMIGYYWYCRHEKKEDPDKKEDGIVS